MLESSVILSRDSKTPLCMQIYEHYKRLISSGTLDVGYKLTSIIKAKESLGVSRNTVESAYNQLLSEGYVYSIPGSGYYVERLDEIKVESVYSAGINLKKYESIHIDEKNFKYNFKPGSVDIENFPFKIWNKLSNEIMKKDTYEILTHSDPRGEELLRVEISKYLRLSRGISCNKDQIIVGAGTQNLIVTLCSIIKEYNIKTVAFEEPGFSAARKVFEDFDYKVNPIILNEAGINLDLLDEIKDRCIVYTTPSNQHPMGMIMPVKNRIRLLNWINDTNSYLIEDDYDSEFRYDIRPVPPIKSSDTQDRVIYLGTFSKMLFPAMHISYMVLPEKIMNAFINKGKYINQTASKVHQLTIAKFMKNNYYEAHIRKMRKIYSEKQSLITDYIESLFGDIIKIHGKSSGLNIALEYNGQYTEEELIEKAKEYDVKVYPLSFYYYNLDNYCNKSVLLGYGHVNKADFKNAILNLKKAWE